MKQPYLDAFNELIELISHSRNLLIDNNSIYENSLGRLVYLGDERFCAYSSTVETNEYRAAKIIERLAVSMFTKYNNVDFNFYPINPAYKTLSESEQVKSRPFQITLFEDGKKYGVIFSNISDVRSYSKEFIDGIYEVDALKIIIIAKPNDMSKKILFTSVNEDNKHAGIFIERIPILDFWDRYFGTPECEELINFCNEFNEKAKEIIGFSTVVSPTENALSQFRDKCGKKIVSTNYTASIMDINYTNQIEKIKHNYLDRGLWRAMIGKNNFAVSFITSEWFYTMYELSESLDLTSIVSGYLKSVEQLLFSIIQLSKDTGITIKTKVGKIEKYSEDNADIIDSTLGALEQIIKHNSRILDVNNYTKEYLVATIDNWRDKQRNGYFHKDNLHDLKKVDEIREKAIYLYFLILGSCTIKDEQFSALGINVLN